MFRQEDWIQALKVAGRLIFIDKARLNRDKDRQTRHFVLFLKPADAEIIVSELALVANRVFFMLPD
ncbi:MAG TPA: hypothetical protein VJ508_02220, partial [Saprospiraceae bacterium]|nr:hypothetical protein [Saprospiraceae bacterium]